MIGSINPIIPVSTLECLDLGRVTSVNQTNIRQPSIVELDGYLSRVQRENIVLRTVSAGQLSYLVLWMSVSYKLLKCLNIGGIVNPISLLVRKRLHSRNSGTSHKEKYTVVEMFCLYISSDVTMEQEFYARTNVKLDRSRRMIMVEIQNVGQIVNQFRFTPMNSLRYS